MRSRHSTREWWLGMPERFWLSVAYCVCLLFFFFSSRRRHTRFDCDWSSDVCSSDLADTIAPEFSLRSTPDQFVSLSGYLGIMIQPVTSKLANAFKLQEQSGALIGEDRKSVV